MATTAVRDTVSGVCSVEGGSDFVTVRGGEARMFSTTGLTRPMQARLIATNVFMAAQLPCRDLFLTVPDVNRKELQVLDDEEELRTTQTLAFEHDVTSVRANQLLVVVVSGPTMYFYDVRDRKLELFHSLDSAPSVENLLALTYDHVEGLVAFSTDRVEGKVIIYNPRNKTFVTPEKGFKAHNDPIAALAFSRDGGLLATASKSGTLVRVWDVTDTQRVQDFRRSTATTATIHCLDFSRDSSLLAAVSDRVTVHVFKVEKMEEKEEKKKKEEEEKEAWEMLEGDDYTDSETSEIVEPVMEQRTIEVEESQQEEEEEQQQQEEEEEQQQQQEEEQPQPMLLQQFLQLQQQQQREEEEEQPQPQPQPMPLQQFLQLLQQQREERQRLQCLLQGLSELEKEVILQFQKNLHQYQTFSRRTAFVEVARQQRRCLQEKQKQIQLQLQHLEQLPERLEQQRLRDYRQRQQQAQQQWQQQQLQQKQLQQQQQKEGSSMGWGEWLSSWGNWGSLGGLGVETVGSVASTLTTSTLNAVAVATEYVGFKALTQTRAFAWERFDGPAAVGRKTCAFHQDEGNTRLAVLCNDLHLRIFQVPPEGGRLQRTR